MKQSRIPHAVIGSISHRVSKLFISVIQNQVGGLDIKGLPRVIHSVLVFKALEDMVIFFFQFTSLKFLYIAWSVVGILSMYSVNY